MFRLVKPKYIILFSVLFIYLFIGNSLKIPQINAKLKDGLEVKLSDAPSAECCNKKAIWQCVFWNYHSRFSH